MSQEQSDVRPPAAGPVGPGGADAAGPVPAPTSAATPAPLPPAAPAPVPAPVPGEQAALDPRAIARASLAAGRNASLWFVSAGVLAATGTAVVVGTRVGALVLAVLLAVCAVLRATWSTTGPVALVVRARATDVALLTALAVAVGVLSQIVPATL
ncbi:hypothetical protein AGMMS50218_01620 [Actinomycetota bacterium]|nr:hypothetical protein AGMMS50218_01620 [Actinomycetota bacterium]